MLKNKTKYIGTAVFLGVLLVAGAYWLMRSPAPKPLPEGTEQQAPAPAAPDVAPVPGVPPFDTGKYPAEPTITVWRADRKSIEKMPLETYIEGVIAQEMNADWPLEALAAQAVVSRTLTINAIEVGTVKKLRNADVSTAKEELQAFAPEKVNDNVRMAVRRTRGQVLLYAGGLVAAIYSSCNGQIAATKEESFPKEIPHETPYFQPVIDRCFTYAPADIQSWTVKIPGTEVAAAVGYTGDPRNIAILEKGPSGRILYIGAGSKKVYGADFRKTVGYDRLKSTLITKMEYDGKNFTFSGLGWGNGVGLCQWGAYTFAREGWKDEEIIRYYYPGTEIIKMYD